MRKVIILLLVLSWEMTGFCQDSSKMKEIDSLVSSIDNAGFRIERDSMNRDQPAMGLKIRVFVEGYFDGEKLRKFSNITFSERKMDDSTGTMNSSNLFYFDHDKLIKVTESISDGYNEKRFEWYFSEGKALNAYDISEKSAARSALLLEMGAALLLQVQKKNESAQ